MFEDTSYNSNHYIQQTTALSRKSVVGDVAYKVQLALPKGDWYGGKVHITFTLSALPKEDLPMDFRGVKIG